MKRPPIPPLPVVEKLHEPQVVGAVDVEVLGPLRVRVGGAEPQIGGRRERAVLSLLAADLGFPVPAERLVEELWPHDAPPSALGSVQVAISRLRGLLEPDRVSRSPSEVLVTTPAGYLLAPERVAVDARSLMEAARLGRSQVPPAATRLDAIDAALARWRGEPYADLADVPRLAAETNRLSQLRVDLSEARGEALLELGRHAEARPDLQQLTEAHPFRERAWALLAVALYREGRQADALGTLRRLRRALVEELGVDPSAEIRALERDILGQAPHLDARPDAVTGGVLEDTSRAASLDLGCCLLVNGDGGIGTTTLVAAPAAVLVSAPTGA